jgi:polysaccharide pyruvyl transferase WcaK-like protein
MIHHVFANRSNIGDWLSAKGIQRLLQPHQVTEHLCDEVFIQQTLVELNGLGPGDLVVIGGGGLFMDYFASFWAGFSGLSRRFRYCIWGVGYCDLKAEGSHPPLDIVQGVVAGSELCVVRDELTRKHLADSALPAPVPCPSLVEIDVAHRGWGLLHVDNYTTVGAPAFETMDDACRHYALATSRPYRRTNNRIEPDREKDLRQCLSLYSMSDLILSSALHGCVIAVAMGKPVLAVSGDWKIEGFMKAAGLGDWVLDANELAQLPVRLEALSEQSAVPDFVACARAQNHAIAQKIRALAETPSPASDRS